MTKKFYELTPDERLALLTIDDDVRAALSEQQSTVNAQLVENYISDFRVPIGVVRDLLINRQHYQVPMATEEPSVIAAANNGAKMLSAGIDVQIGRTAMIGQMMFVTEKSLADYVQAHRLEILDIARQARPSIYQRGGGLLDVVVRQVSENETSVDFIIDTQDAMGANIVDTILEAELPLFESFHPLGVILSNYATQQLVTATADIAFERVGGEHVARQIVALNHFAQSDSYRATTENKGLFNGASAVVLATGNDWRAVEASGHAYASRNGQYQALTNWSIKNNQLHGELTMPISVGTVGGAISVLPAAQNGLAILGQVNADELRMVIVSVGLAQNLAALKAIVSGGIQQGHMRMQYRALAMQVGAEVDEVKRLVPRLMAEKHVDTELATKILMEIRNESKS